MINEMADILELPFEKNLSFIYLMMEFILCTKEYNDPAALKIMEKSESLLDAIGDEASPEALHLYHRNKGFITTINFMYEEGETHYLEALKYKGTKLQISPAIYLNTAKLYSDIGKLYYALLYCVKAKEILSYDSTNHISMDLAWFYATLLHKIGHISEAISEYNNAIARAKKINNTQSFKALVQAYYGLSVCYNSRGDYKQGITYSEKVVENAAKVGDPRTKAQGLFQKAYCYMKLKQHEQCDRLIEEGLAIVQEDELFVMLFKSLSCINNMKDSRSIDYLENVALPYFKGLSLYETSLLICNELEAHYKKNRSKIKALSMAAIARDIYQKILYPEWQAHI